MKWTRLVLHQVTLAYRVAIEVDTQRPVDHSIAEAHPCSNVRPLPCEARSQITIKPLNRMSLKLEVFVFLEVFEIYLKHRQLECRLHSAGSATGRKRGLHQLNS